MNRQKVILFALTLIFGGSLIPAPTYAIDETVNEAITVSGDEDPTTGSGEVYTEDITTTAETDTTQSVETDCDANAEDCMPDSLDPSELETALEEGLANEPEVICATADEEGCGQESSGAMWSLYVSLGALGAAVILVVIINLIGRKKS